MNHYKKLFYWSDEDDAFIVVVPSLPGCMSDGRTIEEAIANADVVVQEWLDFAKKIDNNVPEEDPIEMISSAPNVFDIVAYILDHCGSMSTMKLQKLLYYCQAWCLGWYGKPLAAFSFEDWRDGPVCRDVFQTHREKLIVHSGDYKTSHKFTEDETHLMNNVLSVYQDEDAMWLSEQTHREDPWKLTRGTKPANAKDFQIIKNELISRYYGQAT